MFQSATESDCLYQTVVPVEKIATPGIDWEHICSLTAGALILMNSSLVGERLDAFPQMSLSLESVRIS